MKRSGTLASSVLATRLRSRRRGKIEMFYSPSHGLVMPCQSRTTDLKLDISLHTIYKKGAGVSGFRGLLCEIKLICLMYFRAFHNDTLEEFQIASNVHEMGHFGNICIKAKVKGQDKPVAVFIQVRYKENDNRIFMGNLIKYFQSYCKIRQQFDRNNKKLFLNGAFDDTECIFAIYTNTSTTFDVRTSGRSDFSAILNDLIGTGGLVTQPDIERENVKPFCEVAMKEQMIYLAERMAKCIQDDRHFQLLLVDEIVLRFHVILAREVFDVSEIQPDGYRIAAFRHDFFDTHDEYLSIFKDTLFKEVLTKTKVEPTNLDHLLSEFLTEPTNALKLSKLIGIGIKYNNGHFQLDGYKGITEEHRSDMKEIKVSQSIEDEAIKLAAREILSNLHFKVPAAFGNKDLTIRGSDAKVERRINHLVKNIVQLLEKFKPAVEITVDDSVEHGFLQLNGGIAGAIGNIFVFDDNTKLMKITDNWEQLETVSKRMYLKLNSEIHNMHQYKFCFKFNKCPKFSFDCSQYEENLAIDFLNRLLIYANQASEDVVEDILKREIDNYQSDHAITFEAMTDAIFSRYYCEIQKWWMVPIYAPYLTRQFNLFRESTNNIIKNPLMSSINLICKSKIKQYNYTFTEDAVSFLKLGNYRITVIITEKSIPTVVKVMQQLKNTAHVVLDFDYIANLPVKDCNALCSELKFTNNSKVLILVCDDIKQEKTNSRNDIDCLERIAEAVRNRRTIIVTNKKTFEVIQKYFSKAAKILQDKKLGLIDLHEISQMSLFENATATFPGVEINLDELLRGWPQPGSR